MIVAARVDRLAPGTPVSLPDGTIAYASPDVRVGSRWDGTYRTSQPTVGGGHRIDIGWQRDQFTVITDSPSTAAMVPDEMSGQRSGFDAHETRAAVDGLFPGGAS